MKAAAPVEPTPYRIKDLVRKTGVSKETIHFYITEGLLPKARKTSRNMAWYGERHVERLRTIKELQEKQFLPLKAIKAVLGTAEVHEFTPDQQRTIAVLQSRLTGQDAAAERRFVSYKELASRYRVRPSELDQLEAAGLLTIDRAGRARRVDAADEGIVANWAAFRDLGFTPERGFSPRDAEMLEHLVSVLFDHELTLLARRTGTIDAEEAAKMIEQAVPKINELLSLLHIRRVRRFLTEYPAKC